LPAQLARNAVRTSSDDERTTRTPFRPPGQIDVAGKG